MFYLCIDPIVSVEIMTASIPAIDQQLVLQSTANIVSGTTSIVDIIWTTLVICESGESIIL